ncbi:MAG: FtsX-like permease family protein [Coriobacteriia bacterium]|nr:FtsX-like permease family protein [Coriobacteriia bacterium]
MTRDLGKSLLLFLAILALGTVISGAISIQQAVYSTNIRLRQGLPSVVSIGLDHERLTNEERRTGQQPDVGDVSIDILSEIGFLSQVRNYDISALSHLMSAELERYYSGDDVSQSSLDTWKAFGLRGVNSSRLVDIEEGIIELISGRQFSEEEATTLSYVVLVSEELANLNNLHVGSSFAMDNIVWDVQNSDPFISFRFAEENIYAQRSYDFKVIGIFRSAAQFSTGEELTDASWRDEHINQLYVPNPVVIATHVYQTEHAAYLEPDAEWASSDSRDSLWLQNVFALNDQSDIEAFRIDAENILPDYWIVSDLSDSFSGAASSVQNVGEFATFTLWLTVGMALFILSLFVTLLIRERRQEIGIYLALGQGRIKIISQMLVEVLVIAVVALALSLLAGNMLATAMSESMIRSDMVAIQQAGNQQQAFTDLDVMGYSGEDISLEEVLAKYNTPLNAVAIFSFFAASIAIVFTSIIIPMLYMLRLCPRKIMM